MEIPVQSLLRLPPGPGLWLSVSSALIIYPSVSFRKGLRVGSVKSNLDGPQADYSSCSAAVPWIHGA